MGQARIIDTPLARVGNVEVSKFETITGMRLRLRRADHTPDEVYLDPLELEGLTRARHKPSTLIRGGTGEDDAALRSAAPDQVERLQNEFAMVGVGVARSKNRAGLFIRDMNAGQTVLLLPDELEALLRARHKDFAPLIDTSDLIAVHEPDIDQA
jgi:hypothetical protein